MASLISPSCKKSKSILSVCRQYLRHGRAPFNYRPFSTSIRTSASTVGGNSEDVQQGGQEKIRQNFVQQLLGENGNRNVQQPASSTTVQESSLHHLHVFARKRNVHLALTAPDHKCIITVSAGNIGFRKAARGTYDAAYQLATHLLNKIHQQPELDQQIKSLEVILRGFGIGREAVTKAILGTEGRLLRGRIVRVCDATRLKFGGTRSPKPRRLG